MKWSWLSSFFPPITTLSKVWGEISLETKDGNFNKENDLPDHISVLRQNPRGYPAPPLRWLQTLWWCSAIHVVGEEVNLFTKKVLNGHRNRREPPERVCHGYLQDLSGLALGPHNLQKPTSWLLRQLLKNKFVLLFYNKCQMKQALKMLLFNMSFLG